ncbi:MAG: DUF6530 family protein [Spirochaetales bacterium]|nr:DUF6530 family protein [Spirochaetales bacterium]
MTIPTHLKHKPVVAVNDYNTIDGRFAEDSDAKGLSLGLAQWNDRGNVDISAKIWRHTGEKWSRQSEELPLHRVLDLALLICKTKRHVQEGYQKPREDSLEKIGLQGRAMDIRFCTENPMLEKDLPLFEDAMRKDDEILSERLHALKTILEDMGY